MSSTLFSSFLDLFLLLLSISRFLVGVLLVIVGGVAADIFHMLLPVLSSFSSLVLKEIPWGLIVRGIIALMSAGWRNTPSALRFIRLCLYEYAQDTHDTLSLHIHAIHALVTDPMFRACAWAFVGLVIMAVESVSGYIYLDYTDPNLWALVPVERHPFPEGCGTPIVCLRKVVCGRHDTNNSECQSLASSIWSSEESHTYSYNGDLSVVLFSRPPASRSSRRLICWKSEPFAITYPSPYTLRTSPSPSRSPASFQTSSVKLIGWKDDAAIHSAIRSLDHSTRVSLSIYHTLSLSSASFTKLIAWSDGADVEVQSSSDSLSDPDHSSSPILIPVSSSHDSESHFDEAEVPNTADDVFSSPSPASFYPSPPPSAYSSDSSADSSEDEDEEDESASEVLPEPPTPFFRFEWNSDVPRVRVAKKATPDFRLNSLPRPTYSGHPTFVPPTSPTPAGRNKFSRSRLAPLGEECEMLASSSSSSVDFADLASDTPKFVLPVPPQLSPPSAPLSYCTDSPLNRARPDSPSSPLIIASSDTPPPSTSTSRPFSPLPERVSEPAVALLASAPLEFPAPGPFNMTAEGVHIRSTPKHRLWAEGGIEWSSATYPVHIFLWPEHPEADARVVGKYQEYYISARSTVTGNCRSSLTILPS
ncbi:hypothetical protein BV25DRAFT_1915502 [Artomyces pyxidatus]|uniref:Uncharacterized protein n=1 Tax=Artomyces pyxidatus TaxID=48021 RepID=A0ACB8T5J9_9AGAM|nr:hypothetical protein BV25DRAFT_1915502 [Artomyces pyxidatus]